jgi:hypothetical protein
MNFLDSESIVGSFVLIIDGKRKCGGKDDARGHEAIIRRKEYV